MNAEIARVLDGIPWALPAALLAVVVAAVLARPIARRTGATPFATWLLLASLLAIAGITLTPSADAPDLTGCDVTLALPTIPDLTTIDDRSLNVALFVPLGLAVVAIGTRRRVAWLLLAASLAPLVELTQLLASPLHRTCQAVDVIDNELGLVIGVAVGMLAAWWWRRRSQGV